MDNASSPPYERLRIGSPSHRRPRIIAPALVHPYQPPYHRPRIIAEPDGTSMVPSRLFVARPRSGGELADEAVLVAFAGEVDFAVVVEISGAGNAGVLPVAVGVELQFRVEAELLAGNPRQILAILPQPDPAPLVP